MGGHWRQGHERIFQGVASRPVPAGVTRAGQLKHGSHPPRRVVRPVLGIWLGVACILPLGLYGQAPGTVLWEFSTGGQALVAPALGTDGTVYLFSRSRGLYALDTRGGEKWRFATQSPDCPYCSSYCSCPVVGRNGTIYVANGPLHAVSPAGQEVWRFAGAGLDSPALDAAGTIYVSDSGQIGAVGPNGSLKWAFGGVAAAALSPVIGADGSIYGISDAQVGGFEGAWLRICGDVNSGGPSIYTISHTVLYGLTPQGTAVWAGDASPGHAQAAVGADGTMFVQGQGYRRTAPVGGPVFMTWVIQTSSTGDFPVLATVIGNSGIVYFGECDYAAYYYGEPSRTPGTPYLHAVNPDGSLKWEVPVDGGLLGAAVDAQENIYFGTGTGKFFALDGQGNTLWQLDLGSAVGVPTLGPDGVIYVGTAAGKVSAIKVAAGPGTSPWPQFQRNAQHTGSMESYLAITKSRQISLAGIPTRTYRIELTESLVNPQWRALTNVTLATDTQAFADLLPTNSLGGFYRAVLEP